jgi:hypothetical protein
MRMYALAIVAAAALRSPVPAFSQGRRVDKRNTKPLLAPPLPREPTALARQCGEFRRPSSTMPAGTR